MTTSDRARAFLASKIKRTALVILPLAAAAVQCHATVTFGSSTGSFNASGGSATPKPTVSVNTPYSFATVSSGVDGMTVAGGATFTANAAGLGDSGHNACGVICGELAAAGSGSGIFDSDTLEVDYDFTLHSSTGNTLDWYLLVDVGGQQNTASSVSGDGQEVKGSFFLTGMQGVAASFNWNVDLFTDLFNDVKSGNSITLDIPVLTSIDIGAQVPPTTPEPGTWWLVSGAIGALLLLQRWLAPRINSVQGAEATSRKKSR